MNDKLSKEYFDLVRKVLREKQGSQPSSRPLKRRRQETSEPIEVVSSPEVIALESDKEVQSEEDFDSDDFEDVETGEDEPINDISISMDLNARKKINIKDNKKVVRNVCSKEEKQRRKYMHMFILLCCMVHGSIINEWINDPRLLKKITHIVPEKVFALLHPEKDVQMPLRSTRKLLDGLKKCIELWKKHWRVTKKYDGLGWYMRSWDECNVQSIQNETLTKQQFIRGVIRGVGSQDHAAKGFVALLRSCNVNARLVMSCQPPDLTNQKQKGGQISVSYDEMVRYPIFWCEVWDKFGKKWITIDPVNLKIVEQVRNFSKLTPKGASCCKRNQIRYVVGYDRKQGCRDITRRYVYWFHSKTRRKRITKDANGQKWLDKVYFALNKRKRTKIDDFEDSYFETRDDEEGMPDNMADLKNHPYYVLEKDLKANEVIKAGCKESGYLKLNNKVSSVLKVYERRNILQLKSARQWYMEGRILKAGCRYKKIVKKRVMKSVDGEDEEERLYSYDDTELYIPPLATRSGEIKTNAYGNIEVFVPSMIPANCCLIESPVAIKAANYIRIEFAKAVTGFKFERGRTTKPIISGVVVGLWFRDAVVAAIDGIDYSMENDKQLEIEMTALYDWNKLLMKLRIKNDLNDTYGTIIEKDEPAVSQNRQVNEDFEGSGGFFVPKNIEPVNTPSGYSNNDDDGESAGGFLPANKPSHDDKDHMDESEGGFIISPENDNDTHNNENSISEISSDEQDEDAYNAFMNELDLTED